ncbi:MAG: DegT/DnrJ/EryC1/StrS family aminotransferase [Planctomycetota bacterium]
MTTGLDKDRVPLVDLAAANQEIAAEVLAGMERVIETGAFILGPEVSAFEAEFAEYTQTRHCVGVSNGTDALELALRAAGIGKGDEVILPANTFMATASSVVRAGATPVFVDCDAEHLLIDPDRIAAAITAKSKAIIPVHLFGQMADMKSIHDLATMHGLSVFEDFAQSQGARQEGKPAGSLSLAAATSFYPSKNIGAYGDAGAVVTDDPGIAESLRALRSYGSSKKYEHPMVGFNCRLDSLQAVVLRSALRRLDDWNAKRREAASRYDAMLGSDERLRILSPKPGNEHVYHLYVVEVLQGDRDQALAGLHAAGIGAGVHYPTPLPMTGAFSALGQAPETIPVAAAAAGRILSLPLYPQITAGQQERVVSHLDPALGH